MTLPQSGLADLRLPPPDQRRNDQQLPRAKQTARPAETSHDYAVQLVSEWRCAEVCKARQSAGVADEASLLRQQLHQAQARIRELEEQWQRHRRLRMQGKKELQQLRGAESELRIERLARTEAEEEVLELREQLEVASACADMRGCMLSDCADRLMEAQSEILIFTNQLNPVCEASGCVPQTVPPTCSPHLDQWRRKELRIAETALVEGVTEREAALVEEASQQAHLMAKAARLVTEAGQPASVKTKQTNAAVEREPAANEASAAKIEANPECLIAAKKKQSPPDESLSAHKGQNCRGEQSVPAMISVSPQ